MMALETRAQNLSPFTEIVPELFSFPPEIEKLAVNPFEIAIFSDALSSIFLPLSAAIAVVVQNSINNVNANKDIFLIFLMICMLSFLKKISLLPEY
jgi:hypothetical protein